MDEVTIRLANVKLTIEFAAEDTGARKPDFRVEGEPQAKGQAQIEGGAAPIALNAVQAAAASTSAAQESQPPVASRVDDAPAVASVRYGVDRELQREKIRAERRAEAERRKADLRRGHFPRNPVLEREILRFVSRFGMATPKQMMRVHPIEHALMTETGRYTLAVERFILSEDRACDQLDALRAEGLLTSDAPLYQSRPDSVSMTTREGMELAGMGLLPPVPFRDVAYGRDYFLGLVDLYQGIASSVPGGVAWVSARELGSAEVKTARESELSRKLPSLEPSPHKVWPATPEGVVVAHDGLLAAVGLEMTRASDSRLRAYETVLGSYSRDPFIDRVYLFFTRKEALERVAELTQRYRNDGFFLLKEYRAKDPLGLLEARDTGKAAATTARPPGGAGAQS